MLESSDDFAAVYESHAERIQQFLYWRTGDNALAEDLTSSVFEKAWRSRDSFHGGSVQAWLYRIARNLLTDHWRKKKDLPSDDIEAFSGEVSDDETLSSQLDQAWEVRRLQQALTKLPKDMRVVVHLRFIECLSARQAAKQLGITENNVRIIQYRALRKLRSYLS